MYPATPANVFTLLLTWWFEFPVEAVDATHTTFVFHNVKMRTLSWNHISYPLSHTGHYIFYHLIFQSSRTSLTSMVHSPHNPKFLVDQLSERCGMNRNCPCRPCILPSAVPPSARLHHNSNHSHSLSLHLSHSILKDSMCNHSKSHTKPKASDPTLLASL